MKRYYIIAGEESGDYIGSKLIESLKSLGLAEQIIFYGIGGRNMTSCGLKSLFPITEINLMGFVEVIPKIFRIKSLIKQTIQDIINKKPDVLITIDSPGFTYRIAKQIKQLVPNIKLVHVVAPSVWAYKPQRAEKYAKVYDHLLTLLPFEPEYFTPLGLDTTCIGHPILEQEFVIKSSILREKMNISKDVKIIGVTPGSRKGEINRHMPIIRKVFDKLSTTHPIKIIFIQSDDSNIQQISRFLSDAKFDYCFSTERLNSFAVSDCVLAKSGTNTIEISASGTPMIVGYKLNPITFFLLKLMIKVKYATLINIIAGKEIIPEYIQSDFNVDNITHAIGDLLSDNKRSQSQVSEGQRILKNIGLNSEEKPSMKAAKIITRI
ncbi:MAG: lipid-A-disaccharide synthase [Rickettsiales bacterium]|nr:lipid-A-disaccharide synthase [Rickettsiales bacterium]MCA0254666.1 lipid-A-disaccharide synthase [Pseudomonadota bacterium]